MKALKENNGKISKEVSRSDFPPEFVFGVATSAYQVEGGTSEGGRRDCIWDAFARIDGKIFDGSNGNPAADQYHRIKEDIALMAKLGFKAYRFSISWPRIFPDGLGTKPNEEGIAYYNNLINALLEKGIQPFVTLYQWDLPNNLQESHGGWLSDQIVNYFTIYAETCFAKFGDRVKHWMTINEPHPVAVKGYGTGKHAPGRSENASTEPYIVAHHLLLSHAAASYIYRTNFKAQQGGEIGLVTQCEWAEPFSNKLEDRVAAARHLDFQLGWFWDPIFYGDYPQSMRERLGDRLPKFSNEDIKLLKNSVDFVGINHYTSRYIAYAKSSSDPDFFVREEEIERLVELPGGHFIGDTAASEWLYIVPWGMRRVLNYVATKYNNPPIYITENGMDEEGNPKSPLYEVLNDKKRVRFHKDYVAAVAESIKDGVNVKGYFAWSLLDNWEWAHGYTKRFGLIYVDRKNGLTRHPKSSAYWFSLFLKRAEEKNRDTNASVNLVYLFISFLLFVYFVYWVSDEAFYFLIR